MSNLIASQDNDVIVLVDGTRIEVNTSMDGTPCGWIITEAAEQSVQADVSKVTLNGRFRCPECECMDEHNPSCSRR